MLDLNSFTVVRASGDEIYTKAALFLQGYLRKRAKSNVRISPNFALSARSILIARYADFKRYDFLKNQKVIQKEDSILIQYFAKQNILVIGAINARGLYFSIGRLLREMTFQNDQFLFPKRIKICEAPEKSIRGHQLAYRVLGNTTDTWDLKNFEEHIKDSVLFGTNTLCLHSHNSDIDDINAIQQWADHCPIPKDVFDYQKWPHFKMSFDDYLKGVSEIMVYYEMNCWLWYPNLGDFSKANIPQQLKEREHHFKLMKRIDVLFVPSGDPGELSPEELFAWNEEVNKVLLQYHPQARIWISLQSFCQENRWLERMVALVNQKPSWLGGIINSPWQKVSIHELRASVDPTIPLVNHADMTHNLNSQIPVKNWDKAFAIIYGREAINPRPKEFKEVQNNHAKSAIGSVIYSEGSHDDINKYIFMDMDWNAKTPYRKTLRDYAKMFISDLNADDFERYVVDLEKAWNTPIDKISWLEKNYEELQSLHQEKAALRKNYRFLMVFIRSMTDLLIQKRYFQEKTLLEKWKRQLTSGSKEPEQLHACAQNIGQYLKALKKNRLYQQIIKIGDKIYREIGLQLSVKRHGNLAWNRGAFLDTLLQPISDIHEVFYLIDQILSKKNLRKNEKRLLEIVNPDKQEIYINFKNHIKQDHFLIPFDSSDHSCDHTAFIHYSIQLHHLNQKNKRKMGFIPLDWLSHVSTRFDTPLAIQLRKLKMGSDYRMELTLIRQYFAETIIDILVNDTIVLEKRLRFNEFGIVKTYMIKKEWIHDHRFNLTLITPRGHLGPNLATIKLKPI